MASERDPVSPTAAQAAAPTSTTAGPAVITEEDIVRPLRSVLDPELGVNIVDLGLLCGAWFTADGIRVSMIMTSPSCPMADVLIEDVRAALRREHPDTPIAVEIRRDLPWSPARISAEGRRALGWASVDDVQMRAPSMWPAMVFGSLRRH